MYSLFVEMNLGSAKVLPNVGVRIDPVSFCKLLGAAGLSAQAAM